MKKIEINYTRKVSFNKIVELNEKDAKRALSLNGEDLSKPPSAGNGDSDFEFIAESLTDMTDIQDAEDEIESLNITLYKEPKPYKSKNK